MTVRFRSKTTGSSNVATFALAIALVAVAPGVAGAAQSAPSAQAAPQPPRAPQPPATAQAPGVPAGPAGVVPPVDYVIGTEDILSVKYIEDPNISVVVLTINSRKVFLTGEVVKPGPYALLAPTTVLQLISLAGGLKDFADGSNIRIIRTEKGRMISYRFDYKAIASGKKTGLAANIELKPGDTIVVP